MKKLVEKGQKIVEKENPGATSVRFSGATLCDSYAKLFGCRGRGAMSADAIVRF